MRFASIFAGSGGFDLGLERAGHECVLQVELDDYRRGILARHWPDVPRVRDVRDVRSGEPLSPGDLDLLCGGFPCRDLSVVGRRRGLEHADSEDGSGLFFELARVADDLLRPGAWLLVENVPGMLSSAGGRDFAVLLRTLGDLGFHDLAWRVLDSRLHGVPQSRRRVFVLARRASGVAARRVLLDGPAGARDPRPDDAARAEHPAATPPGAGGARVEDLIRDGVVTRALTARLGALAWSIRGRRGEGESIEGFRPVAPAVLANSGGPRTYLYEEAEEAEEVAAVAENQRGEVLEVPDARTLTVGGGKPGQGYPVVRADARVRRLTPTECERLQGFPDGWTLPDGPSLAEAPSWYELPPELRDPAPLNPRPHARRYEAMGRAVTVPVAEAIGRRLRARELSGEE